MAIFCPNTISRRDFVKGSLAALGAVLSSRNTSWASDATSNERSSEKWAFVSDLHIPTDVSYNNRGFSPYKNLETIISKIISSAPDAVAITGDLSLTTGQPGEYQNLKTLLTPLSEKAPLYVSLGNHDNRDNFLQVFERLPGKRQSVAGKYVVVAENKPVRVILLDSLLYPDSELGLLGTLQRKWLSDYLNRDDKTPTVLCFHHAIAGSDGDLWEKPRLYDILGPISTTKSIKYSLLDISQLYDIIVPISKVKAVIFGHSHAYCFSEYKGIHQINLPATGYNLNDKDPVGWVEVRWTAQGGDFILHTIGGNQDKDGTIKKLTWRSVH
ncbi:MAG: twin-arginine translocation signal domain-containing protein [Phycisphaerae bacterium]|nr:twin-arginine translocation signal domain-containing protein [Phycisphaerae bacterium]